MDGKRHLSLIFLCRKGDASASEHLDNPIDIEQMKIHYRKQSWKYMTIMAREGLSCSIGDLTEVLLNSGYEIDKKKSNSVHVQSKCSSCNEQFTANERDSVKKWFL
jgi:hypothetical protein